MCTGCQLLQSGRGHTWFCLLQYMDVSKWRSSSDVLLTTWEDHWEDHRTNTVSLCLCVWTHTSAQTCVFFTVRVHLLLHVYCSNSICLYDCVDVHRILCVNIVSLNMGYQLKQCRCAAINNYWYSWWNCPLWRIIWLVWYR